MPDEDFQAYYTTITGYYLSNPLQPSSASVRDQPVEKHYIPYRISQNYTIQRKLFPGKKTTFSSKDNKLRSEEHTSELQSRGHLVCRLLLEKKNTPLPFFFLFV